MSENRTKNSIKNVGTGILNQGVIFILGFISRTIFIRTLGTDYLGINGLFSDVISMLSMADLGFSSAMAFSFYKPIAENNIVKIAALVNFYRKIYHRIACAVTILGICVIPFLKYIVNTEEEIPYLTIYYLFSLGNVVVSYLYVYKTAIITADQKNYVLNNISIYTGIIKTIIQIFALLLYKNYILYLSIGILFNFLNNFWASRKAEELYPFLNEKSKLEKEEKTKIYNNIKSVFIYKISGVLLNATDNTLISILINTTMVGYYSNYLMISNKITSLIQIVFTGVTASVGNIVAKESAQKKYETFKCLQSISCIFCGIIVTCFCLLINDLIYVWLGSEFQLDNLVVISITLNIYMACILQPLWSYREATGMYIRTRYVMLVAAIINLVLSIILGKMIGLAGIIFASSISRLLTYCWYEPKILFREYFNEPLRKYITPIIINFIIVVICILAGTVFFMKMKVITWGMLIIKGVLVCGIVGMVFTVLYSRTEGFIIIYNKLQTLREKYSR